MMRGEGRGTRDWLYLHDCTVECSHPPRAFRLSVSREHVPIAVVRLTETPQALLLKPFHVTAMPWNYIKAKFAALWLQPCALVVATRIRVRAVVNLLDQNLVYTSRSRASLRLPKELNDKPNVFAQFLSCTPLVSHRSVSHSRRGFRQLCQLQSAVSAIACGTSCLVTGHIGVKRTLVRIGH